MVIKFSKDDDSIRERFASEMRAQEEGTIILILCEDSECKGVHMTQTGTPCGVFLPDKNYTLGLSKMLKEVANKWDEITKGK